VILAKVLGPVVSSVKHPSYAALKLLLCQPIDEQGNALGKSLLAVDRICSAGEGDTVLLLKEGTDKLPIDTCVAAIVDSVHVASPDRA
jgi:microcompartment protein CcmK/EutM